MSSNALPPKLQKEINTLHSTHSTHITSNRLKDTNLMQIEYLTIFKSHKIKIIFKFDITNIASTINISINNAVKKGGKLPAMAADFLTSMLNDKFNEKMDKMPIYCCIQFFDREFALKNSAPSPLKTAKENRVITQMKEQKQKEFKKKNILKKKHGKEYIVFLRLNRLLEGAQQKKETLLFEELNNLKNSSNNYFGYFFYGTPGIICIRSTSKIIKKFTKTCNDIGKKAVISYMIDKDNIMYRRIASNTVLSRRNDNYNRVLISFLVDHFKFDNKLKTLNKILCGNQIEKHKKNKKKQSRSKDMYIADSKYEFNIEIGIRHQWSQFGAKKGNLHVSIFGVNGAKLVQKYKCSFKRYCNAVLKFEFSSIDFLKKVGNLNKVYLENFTKEPWQVDWIKINVYQISSKKNKNPPILKKEYEATKIETWIKSNSSLYVNLYTKN